MDLPLARVTVASLASAQKRRLKSSPHNDVPQSGPWKCIRRATAAAVAQCRAASWVAQFCMLACLTPKLAAAGLVAAFALVVGSALPLSQALSGALASEMRTLWEGGASCASKRTWSTLCLRPSWKAWGSRQHGPRNQCVLSRAIAHPARTLCGAAGAFRRGRPPGPPLRPALRRPRTGCRRRLRRRCQLRSYPR